MTLTKLRHNDSGIIIIIVIWILAVLSLMAVGLSRSLSVDLSLVKNEMALTRARMASRAAESYVLYHFAKKEDNEKVFDLRYPCGYLPLADDNQALVHQVLVGKTGSFDLIIGRDNESMIYGVLDEAARLNLNALNQQSYAIFVQLLMHVADVDEDDAHDIALSVIDWIDRDNVVSTTANGSGAEQTTYDEERDGIIVKNAPMDHIGELLIIKGMTQEIFEKIQKYVTVFPRQGKQMLQVNLNMASTELMKAIAMSFPNAGEEVVDSAVKKIENFRRGNDNIYCTSDDKIVFDKQTNFDVIKNLYDVLTASEEVVYRNLYNIYDSGNPAYVSFTARGYDQATSMYYESDVTLDVTDLNVVLRK